MPLERGQVFTLDAMVALLLALVAVSAMLNYVHFARPPTYTGQVKVSATAVTQPVKWGWVATAAFKGELPHLEVQEIPIDRDKWTIHGDNWSAHVDIRVPPKKRIVMAILVLMVGTTTLRTCSTPRSATSACS